MERDQATRFVHDLLRLLLSKKGSDLFLTAEFPPAFKIDGRVLAGVESAADRRSTRANWCARS